MRWTPKTTDEFKARQMALNFGALVQTAIANSRADIRANLTRLKRKWRSWFPTLSAKPFQLVLPADDFHQLFLNV